NVRTGAVPGYPMGRRPTHRRGSDPLLGRRRQSPQGRSPQAFASAIRLGSLVYSFTTRPLRRQSPQPELWAVVMTEAGGPGPAPEKWRRADMVGTHEGRREVGWGRGLLAGAGAGLLAAVASVLTRAVMRALLPPLVP